MKVTQWIPSNVLFAEIQRFQRNVDRTEELVFLDAVVTPDGHLAANTKSFYTKCMAQLYRTAVSPDFLLSHKRFNYLQQAFLDIVERHAVHQHFHESGMDVASNNARFALRNLVHVGQQVRFDVRRRQLSGAIGRDGAANKIATVLDHDVKLAPSVLNR